MVVGAWPAMSGGGEGVWVLVGDGIPAGFVGDGVVAEVEVAPTVKVVRSSRTEGDSGNGERWLERGRRCGVKRSGAGVLFVLAASKREGSSKRQQRLEWRLKICTLASAHHFLKGTEVTRHAV
ncbi:hypothetical protein GUJ93_ZPchr0010g8580 [Zizania palustris]|uniref:DUF834 domain-containing protein n=1 Tax=Zizania palustris TaxID=103762 RepID=A0A8J5TBL6_ZIZPA|nr:hypothetical protein GUJ93_ZPchr0010g8580 [Zizania palustris]